MDYSGTHFFSFFKVLFWRFFDGQFLDLATDEIQILALAGIAVTASLLGTFLVLRNMTMVANAISHTILIGIVLCYLIVQPENLEGPPKLKWPLISMPTGFCMSLPRIFPQEKSKKSALRPKVG